MKEIKIVPMDTDSDLKEISSWDKKYKGNPAYESIIHFILEDNQYYSLAEVIHVNNVIYQIGDDETKHTFSIKNNEDELVGFVLATVADRDTSDPFMFLQYLVIAPEHQNKGYGKQVLGELLKNPIPYFDTKPTEAFAYIHNDNYHSMKTFLDMGFDLKGMKNSCMYRAIKQMPNLELDKE